MKYAIIIGYSWLASEITRVLVENGYEVSIIDNREDMCRKASKLPVYVYHADPRDDYVLEKAGIEKASLLIVLTDNDDINYEVCIKAKNYGVPQIIVKVNSHDNLNKFKELNVLTVNIEELLLPRILEFINPEFKSIIYEGCGIKISLITISLDSPYIGKTVREIEESFDICIPYIIRNNAVHRTNADTKIEAGDTLVVIGVGQVIDKILTKIY